MAKKVLFGIKKSPIFILFLRFFYFILYDSDPNPGYIEVNLLRQSTKIPNLTSIYPVQIQQYAVV